MKRLLSIAIIIGIATASCVKEDYFGLLESGNIKTLLVSNQAGNAVIDIDAKTVEIEIPGGIDLSEITIQKLELSSFATADKGVGDQLDLTEPAIIIVTAEDGSTHIWTIKSFVASANPQLENGNLDDWYQTASDYYEPGLDAASTIWGTGNQGTQLLNRLATTPFDLGLEIEPLSWKRWTMDLYREPWDSRFRQDQFLRVFSIPIILTLPILKRPLSLAHHLPEGLTSCV
jgi:hypothetical protein